MSGIKQFFGFVSGKYPAGPPSKPVTYVDLIQNKDYEKARPLLEEGAKKMDRLAMRYLGTLYSYGFGGCPKDAVEAAAWYRQAAVLGDHGGQTALGLCYATGVGTPLDLEEGAYWLYKAGMSGSVVAVESLGQLVDQNMHLIGKHFSEEELASLIFKTRQKLFKQHNFKCDVYDKLEADSEGKQSVH